MTTIETSGGPITLAAAPRYFLRVVRSTPATEDYTLRTQFDYAGNSIADARNIEGIDEHLFIARDQVGDNFTFAAFDSGDFYRFTTSSLQNLSLQLILLDGDPTTTHVTAAVFQDTNNNGIADPEERLMSATTPNAGIVTLGFSLHSIGMQLLAARTGSCCPMTITRGSVNCTGSSMFTKHHGLTCSGRTRSWAVS